MAENGHLAPPVSLSDLLATTSIVNLNITLPYGKNVTIPIGLLSWHEYNEVVTDVLEPVVPKTKLVGGQKVENPDDPDYKAQQTMVREERNMRRALKAFLKGGNTVPGDDFAAQLDAFRQIEAGIGAAIAGFLWQAVAQGQGRVIDLADQFRPVSGNGAADLRALDAETVGMESAE